MASFVPKAPQERSEPPPADDLLERARQLAEQELATMRQPSKQPARQTLLTAPRRFV